MIKGNLGLLRVDFYNSSWGLFSFGWREWALESWSKNLVLCYWHVLCFFLKLHLYCWALVTCLNWRVPSHHVLLLLVLSWCIEGLTAASRGSETQLWACQCYSDWGIGLSVLVATECVGLKEKMKCNFHVWWNRALEKEIRFDRNEGKLHSLGILLGSPIQFHSFFSN